jgi:hypothetical protein
MVRGFTRAIVSDLVAFEAARSISLLLIRIHYRQQRRPCQVSCGEHCAHPVFRLEISETLQL